METDKYVFFWGHSPNKIGVHVFSQWYLVTFVEKMDEQTPITYSNAEQYMMAHKAMLFGDDFYLQKILDSTDPGEIKKYGRAIRGFNANIWDEYKFDIVVGGNRLKYSQNPALMKRLLDTGDKTIVEAAPYDKI